MLYFKCWQLAGEGGDIYPKADSPAPIPAPASQWGKSFYRHECSGVHAGPTCRKQQSALTVIFKLDIGSLTGIILIVLGPVNLQFQGQFVTISLRSVLGTVAAWVVGTVWSSWS